MYNTMNNSCTNIVPGHCEIYKSLTLPNIDNNDVYDQDTAALYAVGS